LAQRLSAALQLAYLDTGKLYRAAAARLLDEGGDPRDARAAARVARMLEAEDLARPDLRAQHVGEAASEISVHREVRAALLDFQRNFARQPPRACRGAVLDGRDIGTVVCPDAQVKLFITATREVRARRRHEELLARGEAPIYRHVLAEIEARDARDRERAAAPLRTAPDAVILDTTSLNADEAFAAAMAIVAEKTGCASQGACPAAAD